MSSTSERWFGAGHSTAVDSAKAGAEAAAGAIAGRTPVAVFVFTSGGHDLAAIEAAVRAEAGAAVVVCGTGFGELSPAGATEHGVAVAALGGPGFTVRAHTADITALGARAAGAEAARAMAGIAAPHTALLLLADGAMRDPHEIVRGAYSVLGAAVPLAGGLTTSGSGQVVGVAIGSDRPIGIGIAHGWRRVEPPMVVTRAADGRIYEFDGEPALDVLQRRRQATGTAAELFDGGRNLCPIGLDRRSGLDIRSVHGGDDEERFVFGTADIAQGSLVWLMEAERDELIAGGPAALREAVGALRGAEPLGVLAFDCGGRKLTLGDDGTAAEVAAMRGALDKPFAGFYTLGEIARVRGAAGMHQLTLVALALA
ncbi:FIST signal transduction protein [Dactylosporangium sp. NPDC051541]|uniref:FIST signal transduction protein n=1 Tax=Dactylosporangium sp. NPDC051541 TaxID=3363977 RepID=UPI0037B421A1